MPTNLRPRAIVVLTTLAAASALFNGCVSVPAYDQELLSKPGMTFSDSPVDNASPQLATQLEPGADASGGAQASGCSACR